MLPIHCRFRFPLDSQIHWRFRFPLDSQNWSQVGGTAATRRDDFGFFRLKRDFGLWRQGTQEMMAKV
jgi:hypothetical protein